MGKTWFSSAGVVMHSFYMQLLSINLVSSINWEVWLKVKILTLIGAWTRPYKSWGRSN